MRGWVWVGVKGRRGDTIGYPDCFALRSRLRRRNLLLSIYPYQTRRARVSRGWRSFVECNLDFRGVRGVRVEGRGIAFILARPEGRISQWFCFERGAAKLRHRLLLSIPRFPGSYLRRDKNHGKYRVEQYAQQPLSRGTFQPAPTENNAVYANNRFICTLNLTSRLLP